MFQNKNLFQGSFRRIEKGRKASFEIFCHCIITQKLIQVILTLYIKRHFSILESEISCRRGMMAEWMAPQMIAFSIIKISIIALYILNLFATFSMNDTQHNNTQHGINSIIVILCFALFYLYALGYYAGCVIMSLLTMLSVNYAESHVACNNWPMRPWLKKLE